MTNLADDLPDVPDVLVDLWFSRSWPIFEDLFHTNFFVQGVTRGSFNEAN